MAGGWTHTYTYPVESDKKPGALRMKDGCAQYNYYVYISYTCMYIVCIYIVRMSVCMY